MIEKSEIALLMACIFIAASNDSPILNLMMGVILLITYFVFKNKEIKKDDEILSRLKNHG